MKGSLLRKSEWPKIKMGKKVGNTRTTGHRRLISSLLSKVWSYDEPFLVKAKRMLNTPAVLIYRGFVRLRHGSRTVGGVAIILSTSREILLVRNSYEPGWGLPGGFFLRNEKPRVGTEREVKEETSITIDLQHASHHAHFDERRKNITFVYQLTVPRLTPSRPETRSGRAEILAVEWFSLDIELPALKPGTESILRDANIHHVGKFSDLRLE